ncbi:sensor domain-containing protein [Candidatus Colwellia aromaticivorans]|uniref:sensor domain-containing protein n=1 Tax=Candidatus Colwellia aromaticivorans TaxID=2267621 RepID=UPI001B34A7CD|nr:EAL domain-containing protein [Candidatus Colwellia aromaticivorans]
MVKKTPQLDCPQNNESERLELIINATGVGIWDWQIQTGALTFNERWAEIIGYTVDELHPVKFDTWSNNLHPEDFKKAQNLLEQIFNGELDLYEIELRMKHKSGHYVWVLASGKLVEKDDEGQPKRMIGTHLDITERKNNALKLHEKEERLSLATVSNGVGIWDLNPQTEELIWDDSMFSLFHVKKEDFSGAYDAWVFSLHPDDRKRAERELHTALSGGKDFETDFRVVWPNGEIRVIKAIAKVFRDKAGKAIRMLGINADITDLKLTEEKLKLAANVFTHARESIAITDTTGTIIDVNDTFTAITGYSREEAVGHTTRILKSGRQSPEFYADMWQALLKEGYWSGEMWNRRKNGEVYVVMSTISAVHDEQGITTHYVSLSNDITPIKAHQEQLERIAHYDVLTNLPNRVLLADRLSQAMLQCSRHEKSIAVVFLDLDGFKAINDAHGHDMGDELLIALSLRMKEALREGDSLARIGGDEFVAVLADLAKVEDCDPVLKRLLLAASEPITIGGIVLNISASIGVTLYPQDNVDGDQLMRHADQAMYVAKESGKNRYHLFDTAQDDAVKVQRESLEAIRSALDNHQFVLHYQPKVNMRTGRVIGVEALIRWQHPVRGLLNPIEFLPVIENNPMSIEMGEWVIDTALTQISQWQAIEQKLPVSISVNIAAVQLQQPDFTDRLTTLLAAHPDVKPCYLELEVLETSALDDVQHVSTIMNDCMALGVKFSLDDFGTGYSSLTYLRRLPANLIKIDQSFVRDMLIDVDDLAIIEGVIALAKSFKRDVIAEGVETIEHGTALLQLGCELAQGYGIARPMPASDIPAWINGWKPDVIWQN